MRSDDRGVALLTVIGASLVMTLVSLAAVKLSMHSLDSTSVDRDRVQATGAAQGGLDATYHALGSATGTASLPCGVQDTTHLSSGPTASNFTVTISYYASYPVTTSALTCSQVTTGSIVPLAAEIKSVGSTNSAAKGSSREMDSLVHLSANASGPSFDKAVFSEQTMTNSGDDQVLHYSGNDGDVYTNGDINCPNSTKVEGNVYVQGSFSGTGACQVLGDVWAKGHGNGVSPTGIRLGPKGSAEIFGNAKVSNGDILMDSATKVDQSAWASGSNSGGTVVHSRYANYSGLQAPPYEAFPQLNYSQAAWQSAGYQILDRGSNCTQVYTDVTNMRTATQPTLIKTSCALSWASNPTLPINQDLAIVSTGGFTIPATNWCTMPLNGSSCQTATSPPQPTHKLYLIVPYNAAAWPCPTTGSPPNMSLSSSATFWPALTVLLYTPCVLSAANAAGEYGQVYGGTVNATNGTRFHYRPIGALPGLASGGPIFAVGIQYEREVAVP